MDLNQAQVGYFIGQFIAASKYYGFSDADAATLSTFMNARYNIRCSPPVDGQLYSICLAKDCPLAAPEAQCDVYSNVQPYGLNESTVQTGTETMVLPTTAVSSAHSTTTSTAVTSSTSPSIPFMTAASSSSSSLSGGAIAGIVIGAVAVALLAAGMWLFYRHKQRAKAAMAPAAKMLGSGAPTYVLPQSPFNSNLRESYSSQGNGTHDAYMATTLETPQQARGASTSPQELDADSQGRSQISYNKFRR